MRVRRLAVAAVAVLAAFPFSPAMASTTTDLPRSLPNALEPNLAELTSGFFDAGMFADDQGFNPQSRQAILNLLTSNGFVTGYQRVWSDSSTHEALYETALVFQQPSGANRMLAGNRDAFSQSSSFQAWVPVQLNESGFAMEEADTSARWVFIGFTKKNDVFELFRGSVQNFATAAALAQADAMYRAAPNGTVLATSPAQASPLTQFRAPLLITFIAGTLLISVALVIAVIATFNARRPEVAPAR